MPIDEEMSTPQFDVAEGSTGVDPPGVHGVGADQRVFCSVNGGDRKVEGGFRLMAIGFADLEIGAQDGQRHLDQFGMLEEFGRRAFQAAQEVKL